jgi:glutathione S-transferase
MADVDVKYLREKNIAQLLESIAADLAIQKPANPEQYLRERFAFSASDGVNQGVLQGDPVTVYASSLDPCCAMVLLAAGYARAAVDYSEVDIDTNKHLTAAFTAINPFQKVPVLDHKGLVVSDSGAIVRYLCHGKPALPLAPRDRARIDTAFEAVRCNLLAEVTTAAVEAVFAPRRSRRPVDQAALGACVLRVREAMSTITNTYFKDSVWLVGRSVTVADMALAAGAFTMANLVGQDVCTEGPAKIWFEHMQKEAFYNDSLKGYAAAAAQARSPATNERNLCTIRTRCEHKPGKHNPM